MNKIIVDLKSGEHTTVVGDISLEEANKKQSVWVAEPSRFGKRNRKVIFKCINKDNLFEIIRLYSSQDDELLSDALLENAKFEFYVETPEEDSHYKVWVKGCLPIGKDTFKTCPILIAKIRIEDFLYYNHEGKNRWEDMAASEEYVEPSPAYEVTDTDGLVMELGAFLSENGFLLPEAEKEERAYWARFEQENKEKHTTL